MTDRLTRRDFLGASAAGAAAMAEWMEGIRHPYLERFSRSEIG